MKHTKETAEAVLNRAEAVLDGTRGGHHYGGKYHAVNVKVRSHFSPEDLPRLLDRHAAGDERKRDFLAERCEWFSGDDYDSNLWAQFCEDGREQIEEAVKIRIDEDALGDIEPIEYLSRKRLDGTKSDRYIAFLGRSGGWACFKSRLEEYQDALAEALRYGLEDDPDALGDDEVGPVADCARCLDQIEVIERTIAEAFKAEDDLTAYAERYIETYAEEYTAEAGAALAVVKEKERELEAARAAYKETI